MSGRVSFRVGDVRPLYEHSKSSASQGATFSDLFDPKFHKGGKVLYKDGTPDADNIDRSLIPPSLLLVGDQGIYLMSNGSPALPGEDGSPNRVVYAKECDPNTDPEGWYDAKRTIWGGDDSGERLPLTMFEGAMAWPDDAVFQVSVTAKNIRLIPPRSGGKAKR